MKLLFASLLLSFANIASAQTPTEFPLFTMENLVYDGAFRLPAAEFGNSDLNFSQGPIEYNPDNHSLFIVGHTYQQAIAEFAIPEIVNTEVLSELNMAGDPIQEFSSVLDRPTSGNSQNIDRIGGMKFMGSSLLVNAYEYYDADGSVTHSTLKINDCSDIAGSAIQGYYGFDGGAGQTSGWISSLPSDWASYLGATYLTGQSSGIPIISRTSVGPTAYLFDPQDIDTETVIPSQQMLDFSYPNGIHEDLYNSEGENDKWTHLSQVTYGFVVPGTRTYLTIGKSGGHESGVCYKCTQDNGNLCGGYCTPEAADNYQYYWLWDMNNLIEVKNGERLPYEVQPYEYGKFNTPFQNGFNAIGGGSYDPASNKLYLSVQRADRDQGTYANPPVIVVYKPVISSVVPVEWIEFTATKSRGDVLLDWAAVEDGACDKYRIQRNVGSGWEDIGQRKCDDSGSYHFKDRKPEIGLNLYRIKQIDFNGAHIFSKVLRVESRASEIILSPNPVNDVLSISSKDNVRTYIFSITGKKVLDTIESEINLAGLARGIYLVFVNNEQFKIVKN